MTYRDELTKAMLMVAKNPKAVFVGQAVRYPGQAAYPTFEQIPMEQRIELPVAEDFQAGFCMGLSMQGFLPVCFYPRWDFALLAANQIVNHIDNAAWLGWHGKVIIRVGIGWKAPADQGPQHRQDYTEVFRSMCEGINVVRLESAKQVMPAYRAALVSRQSSIIVERIPLYNT